MTTRQFSAYALVLLMPFGAALPLTQPFAPGVYWLYVTPALEVTDAAALLLVLLTVAAPRRPARRRRGVNAVRLLAALTALGAVSVLHAWVPPLALASTARWALAAAVCWALIDADLPLERLAAVFVGGVCLQSLVAIVQAINQGPLGLPGELVPAPDWPGVSIVTFGPRRWLRAYGLTFHPNVLGGFLSVGLILALPLLGHWLARLAWCVMSVALLASFSRSAWVATALIVAPLAVWVWRHERRARRGLAIAVVIAVAGLSSAGWIWRDFISARIGIAPTDATTSTAAAIVEQLRRDERIGSNAVALRVIVAHPLLGIGAGNSPLAEQRAHLAPQYPHNVALMLAAEVGIVGGLVWLALMAVAAWRLVRSSRPTWLVAGVAACAALQIIALLDCYPWSLNGGRLLTVTVLAIIETAARQASALTGREAPTVGGVGELGWSPRTR